MKKRTMFFTQLLLSLALFLTVIMANSTSSMAACNHNQTTRTVGRTCTSGGYTQTYCSKCNYVFRTYNYTSAWGHNYTSATCTTAKKCTRCNATSGGPLGHDYANATCTAPKICRRCHISSGGSLGHNYTNATCTTAKKCTRCNNTSGSALGHNPVIDKTLQNPTCTNPGVQSLKCSRCGTGCGSQTTSKLGHDYGYSFTNSSCTTPGYKIGTCRRCNDTTSEVYKAPLGHNPVEDKEIKNATCTTAGVRQLKCSRCGDGCGTKTINALGHNYSYNFTDPTCTIPGYKIGTCSRCNDITKIVDKTPLGHNSVLSNCVEPTCTEEGISTYKCSRCNLELSSRSIDALGHWYESVPCTGEEKCSRCGLVNSYSIIKTNNHEYDSPYLCVDATCKKCGNIRQATISHSFSKFIACDMPLACYRCGALDSEVAGHILADATCSSNVKCTRPECEFEVVGSQLKHVPNTILGNSASNNGMIDTSYHYSECVLCKEVFKTEHTLRYVHVKDTNNHTYRCVDSNGLFDEYAIEEACDYTDFHYAITYRPAFLEFTRGVKEIGRRTSVCHKCNTFRTEYFTIEISPFGSAQGQAWEQVKDMLVDKVVGSLPEPAQTVVSTALDIAEGLPEFVDACKEMGMTEEEIDALLWESIDEEPHFVESIDNGLSKAITTRVDYEGTTTDWLDWNFGQIY